MKLRGSALFFAIVISLLISIVSGSLLLFSYLSRIDQDQYRANELARGDLHSAIQLLMSDLPMTSNQLDLYNDGKHKLTVNRGNWGAFEFFALQSGQKHAALSRAVLCGTSRSFNERYALYLQDRDKPLAVCGKTIIKGKAFLPVAGIRQSYIEGQNFTGDQPVYGEMLKSARAFPEADKNLLSRLSDPHAFLASFSNAISRDGQLLVNADSLSNSFFSPAIVYSSDTKVLIANGSVDGQFIITSSAEIEISATATIRNAILFAPKIIIDKGVSGFFQAFATDSVVVGENVSLQYPSVLAVVNKGVKNGAVLINAHDTIRGSILGFATNTDQAHRIGLVCKKDSWVIGEIISNGYADLQGMITGSVLTSSILLTTPSSVYEQQLLNCTIDANSLPVAFAGLCLFKEKGKKTIVAELE